MRDRKETEKRWRTVPERTFSRYDGCDAYLPGSVVEWSGIEGLNHYGDGAGVLIYMNDTAEKSFDEISDWIEENL